MDELRYQLDLLNAMNQQLKNEEKMYRLICNISNNAYLYVNLVQGYVRTLGNWKFYFPEVEIGDVKDITKLYSQVEEKYILPLMNLLYLEKTEMDSDSGMFRLKDGRTWIRCEASIVYDEDGKATDKIIRFKDISRYKRQNDELAYMAYYDMLTGLYNRNYFVKLLAEYVRRAEAENAVVAVMFIDIDDFRKLNDSMGIVAGDEVVQQFGDFLKGYIYEDVLVSHFNADSYCIAIYEPCGKNAIEHIHKEIQERLSAPFVLSTGQEIAISVSVGVAEYPEAAKSALELINCAEIVMFRAKASGNGAFQYFDAPILNDFLQNISMETKLKGAAARNSFTMDYQPQYYAADKRLRGMEALIRWQDDDGKMISPSVFIPIAEKNGMIVPIGDWVIEESIRTFAQWKQRYSSHMILSMNISAIQYKRSDFVDNLLNNIKKYGIDPSELELEITESVLIDNLKEVTEKLHVLRDYGIRISLDDFGTGYSSLSYLKGLPIDTLKIDKSFIDTITTDENTQVITQSVIFMGKKLGFEIVAEGVETEEQFDYLKDIGCDCIQGYLFGKPMPDEAVQELLGKAV